MMTIEERLEAELHATLAPEQLQGLDRRLAAAIAGAPRRPRQRFRLRRGIALAAAAVLLVPGLIAAAILSTESPGGLATAEAFAIEVEAAKAAVPLPPGRSWPGHLTVAQDSTLHSRGGGRSWVESNAVCIWLDEWLDARQIGATGREVVAARTIAAVPGWPSWTGPFWTDSVRDHLAKLIAAVAAGHEAPVREEMSRNCEWLVVE